MEEPKLCMLYVQPLSSHARKVRLYEQNLKFVCLNNLTKLDKMRILVDDFQVK